MKIRDRFKDFEITELKKIPEAPDYNEEFDVGEKTVNLGDSEIIITVKSTLEEIDRNELFDGSLSTESEGFMLNLNYLFYAAVIAFFTSGGLLVVHYIKKKRDLKLTPYERFNKRLCQISPEERDLLVKLTMYFKEYLEQKFSLCIRGKTSTEITGEISTVGELRPLTGRIRNWLNESDYFKFSGYAAIKDKKQELLSVLREIVSEIERTNEGKA